MALLASTVITNCGFHLNDTAQSVFTNTVLLGHLRNAVRDLQEELAINDLEFLEEATAEQTIAAGVVIMNTQPTDMLMPSRFYERLSGSTIAEDYRPMNHVDRLPQRTATTELLEWEYRENVVNFLGATVARQIKCEYIKTVGTIAATSTDLVLLQAENYLSYRTSHLAAFLGSRDSELAAFLEKNANRAMETLLTLFVKGDQDLPARQIPYTRKLRNRFRR